MQRLFRYKDGVRPNLLALLYVILSYSGGIVLILGESVAGSLAGTVLLAHGMVIAAYLVHECAHNTIFRKVRYHRWLAEPLLWVCGGGYSDYEDIRHKHVRHHTDRGDIVAFDYRPRLARYPRLLNTLKKLEWCYIPAVELLMHLLVIVLPFIEPGRARRRTRVLTMLLLRGLFFTYLATVSLKILLFYPLAYMLFLTVMRFMDAHQHTYELFETLDRKRGAEAKKFDREFEQQNTYSNLLSRKYPWVNLLVLNFPYHNAHHEMPGIPWHRLPALHRKLYPYDQQVLEFSALLKSYHHYRVERILNEDSINLPVKEDAENFIGVDGVSFLVTH